MKQSNASYLLPLGCLIDMLNTVDSTYRFAPCLKLLTTFSVQNDFWNSLFQVAVTFLARKPVQSGSSTYDFIA